jgi:anti-sigma factor RsiW
MLISEDLTCRELVELVTEYLDGTLAPGERDRFEQHVILCDGCAFYLDQIRTTIAVTGSLTEDSVTPEAQKSLLRVFRDWKGG